MKWIPNDPFVVLAMLDGRHKAVDFWLRCYEEGRYSWETNGETGLQHAQRLLREAMSDV